MKTGYNNESIYTSSALRIATVVGIMSLVANYLQKISGVVG